MYDLSDPIYAAITSATAHLLIHDPFYGQIISRLELELTNNDSWCNTAATDGRTIYFNREFAKSLTHDEITFVLCHEILHCLFDHIGSRGGRDPKIWNMATDYLINYVLNHTKTDSSTRLPQSIGKMPANGLYDKRFTDEMTSGEIYDILVRNSVKIEMPLDIHLEMNGEGDDGDNEGEGKGDGDGDGDDNGLTSVTILGSDGPPTVSQDELDEIKRSLRSAAIQAMQNVKMTGGNIPYGVARILDELIESKMDWRSLIATHIRSAIRDDFTYKRISRRDMGSGFVMPSQDILETIEVDVAIDASGSMTEIMLRDILSEVKGIMQTFNSFKLRVWTFDTKVYGFKEFSSYNLNQIDEYELKGGGGTMFECNWEFMKEQGISPHRFILFTDGYPCGTWGDPNYCDTLFVIHGNTNIVADFGQTAYYEAPEKLAEAA